MDLSISPPSATGDASPSFERKGVAPICGAPIFGAIDLGDHPELGDRFGIRHTTLQVDHERAAQLLDIEPRG